MEFVFLVIAIIMSLSIVYGVGRTLYSHKQLIREYKTNELLVSMHLMFGIVLIMTIFITLAAFNNTFWHLPYLTV